jgi:nitrite reductase/ring-hydroxylating ferredoxin subunit
MVLPPPWSAVPMNGMSVVHSTHLGGFPHAMLAFRHEADDAAAADEREGTPGSALQCEKRKGRHMADGHEGSAIGTGRAKMITGRFVRNAWYVAGWSQDLGKDQLLARTILNQPVVLYRKADGGVAALEDRCAHRFAPLSAGRLVGDDRVQCLYHGLEFDPAGNCAKNPHGGIISSR